MGALSQLLGRAGWFAVAIAVTGACVPNDAATDTPAPSASSSEVGGAHTVPTVPVVQVASSPDEDVPSALLAARGGTVHGLPEPEVSLFELTSGGPPPDGIPPIDEPRFVAAADVDFLADDEPVLAIEIDGDARAYPVQVMIWHEIVNDTVGGVPIAVTYCPLCNSAIAYDRRVGERVLSFGTSGLLWRSALVMYDRQTESLWSHFTGTSIAGVQSGTELDIFPVATVPWGAWRDAHPDGIVLSRDTGVERDYGRNPYPGYDDVNGTPFLFEGEVDGRFTAMTRVVGVELDGAALAVPLIALRERSVIGAVLAGVDVTVWWSPGTVSALDEGDIADGDDIGSTGVFVPVADGRRLTFTTVDDTFVDTETGSTWNLFGEAVAGPLTGARLEQVAHVDTFWFAWAAFRPDTTVVTIG
ncbi:MAG: DUF3179 domain-containing protein [Ilumatobacteraceae bacterium]